MSSSTLHGTGKRNDGIPSQTANVTGDNVISTRAEIAIYAQYHRAPPVDCSNANIIPNCPAQKKFKSYYAYMKYRKHQAKGCCVDISCSTVCGTSSC